MLVTKDNPENSCVPIKIKDFDLIKSRFFSGEKKLEIQEIEFMIMLIHSLERIFNPLCYTDNKTFLMYLICS